MSGPVDYSGSSVWNRGAGAVGLKIEAIDDSFVLFREYQRGGTVGSRRHFGFPHLSRVSRLTRNQLAKMSGLFGSACHAVSYYRVGPLPAQSVENGQEGQAELEMGSQEQ
ncbi:hypothetical protein T08_793 [Trichinella sp. T8]|nr:hypothetical protein T08_793 [Trichinella sp. T8]